MSLKYTCPLPAAISDLSPLACAEHFGQILRIGFQRIGTSFPDLAGVGGIQLLASWTALIAAVDGTKIQVAPIHENFVIPAGEAITEGGDDNSTPFGQAIVVGAGQITASGRYRGLPSANKKELDTLVSESGVFNQLGVYLFNEHGQIICQNKTGTEYEPFPITGYFIGSVDSQGNNTHNFNMFQWSFASDWSNDYVIVDPTDFNPLLDL